MMIAENLIEDLYNLVKDQGRFYVHRLSGENYPELPNIIRT